MTDARSWTIRAASLVAALGVTLLASLAGASPALAKDYTIPNVAIEAKVLPDGTLDVVEERILSFSGDFTYIAWSFNKKGGNGFEVVGLNGPQGDQAYTRTTDPNAVNTRPPGTYLVTDTGTANEVRAFFRLSDTAATFTLHYRVPAAAKRWADTAEMYWQFIGDQSSVGVQDVSIHVTLPSGVTKDEVKAWAHGPLNGTVAIEPDGSVTLAVSNLPPQTFVEARILFPASALTKASASTEARVGTVMAEEKQWADQANAQREQARAEIAAQRQRQATARLTAYPCLALWTLFAIGLTVWLFLRYGREYKPKFPGGYFREVPVELTPALVGALWRMGTVGNEDIGATLMDLSIRGVVTMQPTTEEEKGVFSSHTEQTYQLTLDRTKLAQANPIEQGLLTFLFDDTMHADSFTIADLRTTAKAAPKAFTEGLSAWKASVGAEAATRGFIEVRSKTAMTVTVLVGTATAAAGVLGFFYTQSVWPCLGVLPGVAIIMLARTMKRRSPEANELYAKYRGLRDYLRDFSRLDEAPPMHIILWQQFLVLAVVFGIAEQVIAAMRVRIPDVVNDPGFRSAYWWAYAGSPGGSPISALNAGVASAASVATSQMSSASGGGGGFSGGGGGGGGGGGFGAG